MNHGYGQFDDLQDIPRLAEQLSAKTIVFDVEPLVAHWDSAQATLDHGIPLLLEQVRTIPGLLVVCFATNSGRRPSVAPESPGVQVEYVASAGKPLRTSPYLHFPRPGVVVGDQILTDGLLARRLGYAFLYYSPAMTGTPLGPRLLRRAGELIRPLLFAQDS